MSNDRDDLTGIFDDIRPEDFRPFQGASAFDQFVKQHIEASRLGWLSAEGHVNPVAVLATQDERWMIDAQDGETLGAYVDRLRDEAQRLNATWLFLSRKTLVGNIMVDADSMPDASDPEALQKAIEEGLVGEGLFYYAERHEGDQRETRHGIMRPTGNRLGDPIEGNPQHQTVSFFSNIL